MDFQMADRGIARRLSKEEKYYMAVNINDN